MDQIKLTISDSVAQAMESAFEEAQARLTSGMAGFDPFTVTVVDGGLEFNDHPCESPEAVHESVRMLLAMDMPEGYALCYDGYVEMDEGPVDAIIVEVADRGVATAECLALIYTNEDGVYTFETDYGYAGPIDQLYPAGTKPIVSGLRALEEEEALADAEAGEDPAPESEQPAEEGAREGE